MRISDWSSDVCSSDLYAVLVPVSRGYPPRQGRFRCIPHPSATRHPGSKLPCAAVRLACVRPTASVHSEPGSNSSLKFCGFGSRRTSANLLSAVVVTELQNHSLAIACIRSEEHTSEL